MLDGEVLRRLTLGLLCLSVAGLFSGCHHRQMPPLLPAVILTPTVPPSPPVAPPMESSPPETVSTAPPVKVTEVKPKRNPKRTTSKGAASDAPPPVDETTAGSIPDASAIGELSAGDDSNPRTQQETSELIVESEHRLDAFPQTIARAQQSQIRKVRYFLKQAKQALSTGDTEGARTLATKAKLLMDDLEK